MNRVLLVEDSHVTQSIVRSALKDVCEITTADSVAATFDVVADGDFDLIILDINLPDGDGFELYQKIRVVERFKFTPILFLTGRVDIQDKVRGFSLGADDYIVKPFDITELRVRISAKLKNLHAREASADVFTSGPFEVKVGAQKVTVKHASKEDVLELTANQFKVLYYFLRNEERVVSREELLREVWGDGVHVSGRTIDTHIYALRRKLGSLAGVITSVHGQGYRFSLKAEKASA